MLRRLLMNLLILCLALPALAPSAMAMNSGKSDAHCAQMMAMQDGHHTPAPGKAKHPALAMADHQCIGCIAGRHDGPAPVTTAPQRRAAPHVRPMPQLTGLAYSPAIPPPRS